VANQVALARLAAMKRRRHHRPVQPAVSAHRLHMDQVGRDARVEAIDAYHARRNGVVF